MFPENSPKIPLYWYHRLALVKSQYVDARVLSTENSPAGENDHVGAESLPIPLPQRLDKKSMR